MTKELWFDSQKAQEFFFLLSKVFRLMGAREYFTGLKEAGREADLSPPSSAEVKNEWNSTSNFQCTYMHVYLVFHVYAKWYSL